MGTQSVQPSEKHICAGLLAHVDAGKTTLSESLLYTAGSIRKLGKVDTKDAFLDTNSWSGRGGSRFFPSRHALHGRIPG
mgnify:CR=1 FL=1